MSTIKLFDIGLISYDDAFQFQEQLFQKTIAQKLQKRDNPDMYTTLPENNLIFCEHHPVITLGQSGDKKNLLFSEDFLKAQGIDYYHTNRGGDVTLHNPQQLVGYPVLDLDQFQHDIHLYLRDLEEVIILTLADFNLKGERYEGFTGVWLDVSIPHKARKICAMGVRTSRWVTMHGFALNVNNDLNVFNFIVPCGIEGKQVTSLQKELNQSINMLEVKQKVLHYFAQVFNTKIVDNNPI